MKFRHDGSRHATDRNEVTWFAMFIGSRRLRLLRVAATVNENIDCAVLPWVAADEAYGRHFDLYRTRHRSTGGRGLAARSPVALVARQLPGGDRAISRPGLGPQVRRRSPDWIE